MRPIVAFPAFAAGLTAACDSPPAQTGQDTNLVNATQNDQAFPSQATGNDVITGEDTTTGRVGNASGAAAAPPTQQGQQGQQRQQGQQNRP
jgi:hypothetical protein